MNRRVQALSERFEQANSAVRLSIANASDEQLLRICPAEQCTVAALACHIASVHRVGIEWMRAMLDGRGLPVISMEEINRKNQAFFRQHARVSRSEALALLEQDGQLALAGLRDLHDTDLDRACPFSLFGNAMISVQTLIEQVLIGDPVGHLPSIQAALDAGSDSFQEPEPVSLSMS